MDRFITAFGMAWGNFLRIPSPIKKWDESLRKTMLGFLPFIGIILGLIWILVAWVFSVLPVPGPVGAFVMTFVIYAATGGLHLDGYMDVSDAIMSRRSLEERRRILKDSHAGAFAIMMLVFLVLGTFASIWGMLGTKASPQYLVALIAIPVVSRGISGLAVLNLKPMETSQYNSIENKKGGVHSIAIIIQLVIYLAIIGLIAGLTIGRPCVITLAITSAATAVASILSIFAAKKNLDGMNGDIAGWGISIGELAGLLALSVSLAAVAILVQA